MSRTLLLILAVSFLTSTPATAYERSADDKPESDQTAVPTQQTTVWGERPHRVMVGIGYPNVLDIRYSYAVLPRLRAGVAFVGLPPFLFGGSVQGDYLLFESRFGKKGFITGSAGLQALFLKYNFGVVGIQPNDLDWGVGPELALDVGVAWFSAGLAVGVLAGDWRSLERDIAPDVTPGSNLVITFSLPRLAISW